MADSGVRSFWMAIHRYLGLATLVFLAIAGVTGCVLTVDKPLDAALNADLFRQPANSAPLDAVQAAQALQAARPDLTVLSFPAHVSAGDTVPVSVTAADPKHPLAYSEVFVDRADGHLAGTRMAGAGWDRRHLMQGVYSFHYTLLAGTAGRWLMGICALGWLIGNVVGLYLTFPTRERFASRGFWKKWSALWTFRLNNPLPRVFLDLHRASGLWLLVPATVLAFTSVAMNFFDEAFTPTVQALSPARPSPFDGPPPAAAPPPPRISFAQARSLAMQRAAAVGLGWTPARLSYSPERGFYSVMLTAGGVETYSRLGPIDYAFDGAGRFVSEDNPYSDSAGRKLSRALYPLHSGQVIGLPGVVLIFVLGLATAEMSVTGVYLWWKRRGPRIAGERRLKALREAAP
ncbi:PepSY-associated TM helix domain-containing protein [Caulobacter sp. KR2-114]|uniref:PepSY-associated TM helix domain-containing protein n=1 Tax=Caulobacter sp. KR2-114 TaxID=3400912 RepID=UPI003C0EAFDC